MVRTRDFLLLLLAFLAVGVLLTLLVRLALRPWWSRRPVRAVMGAVIAADAALPVVWFALMRLGETDTADNLVTLLLVTFFGQLVLCGLLVMVALLRASRRAPAVPDGPGAWSPRRRRFLLQGAAMALPTAAAAAGLGGVAEAASPVRVRRRTLAVPDLPPELDGLRILHFADVHLWHLVRLPDLERALRRAPRGEYDLVCVTGDLADDMSQLPRALELIAGLEAPLGHYACLGNHEHARDLPGALAAFADGPVTLLRTAGVRLQWRGRPFVLAGIDDLRAVPRIGQAEFYPDQLERALAPVAEDAPTILLSHRPSVLPHAARAGVDVVLAGHTHGGQLAIAGTSILELNGAARWAWGTYREGRTAMHVTCGMGQWFPFRLGCPPEMVVVRLRRAGAPGAA